MDSADWMVVDAANPDLNDRLKNAKLAYDEDGDTLFVTIEPEPAGVTSEEIANGVLIRLSPDNRIYGYVFLNFSKPVL